jgi:hypothetical protein
MKTIDDVLRSIKEAYQRKTQDIDRVVLHVEEKLQAYKRASQQELLNTFLARNGFETERGMTDEAALALYDAVGALPEFGTNSPTEMEDDDVEASDKNGDSEVVAALVPAYSSLVEASQLRPLCIFGGYIVEEKLAWVRRQGIQTEWVGNDGGARKSEACERLAGQIRAGKYCCVITLQELMSHHESASMLAACRASNTPHAFGRKAGRGQLQRIFEEFDLALKGRK